MPDHTPENLNVIINELNTLIAAIENHPSISPWVVRHVLKSIKSKAERMARASSTV